MAIIIVKFSPNAAARRRGLSFRAEELEDVQARMGKLLSDLALDLKLRGKALTDGRAVYILTGSSENAMMLRQILDSTGAYEGVEVELITEFQAMMENAPTVKNIAEAFRPPDQDEIDRMLLDE